MGLEALICRGAFQQPGKLGDLGPYRLIQLFETFLLDLQPDDLSGEYRQVVNRGCDGQVLLCKLIANVPNLCKAEVAAGKICRIRRITRYGRLGKGLGEFLASLGIDCAGIGQPGGRIDTRALFGKRNGLVGYTAPPP